MGKYTYIGFGPLYTNCKVRERGHHQHCNHRHATQAATGLAIVGLAPQDTLNPKPHKMSKGQKSSVCQGTIGALVLRTGPSLYSHLVLLEAPRVVEPETLNPNRRFSLSRTVRSIWRLWHEWIAIKLPLSSVFKDPLNPKP